MALKVVLAFVAPTQLLAFGLPDDRALADQAVPAVKSFEATWGTERVAGIGNRRFELAAALRVAAAVSDWRIGLRRFELAAI